VSRSACRGDSWSMRRCATRVNRESCKSMTDALGGIPRSIPCLLIEARKINRMSAASEAVVHVGDASVVALRA